MEFKTIKPQDIIIRAKNFTPKMPELLAIDFVNEHVTVLDNQNIRTILPFSEINICEIIDPKSTI